MNCWVDDWPDAGLAGEAEVKVQEDVDGGLRRCGGGLGGGVMRKGGWVYFMSNRKNGILYCGVTADLVRRVGEHREGLVEGFTKQYGLTRLVFFERHEGIEGAIARETAIKNWARAWKVRLIVRMNPEWEDLWAGIL